MLIERVRIFTEDCVFRCGNIEIVGDRFRSVTFDPEQAEDVDPEMLYAIPGLCDLHFHGCEGMDFCDGTTEAFSRMAHYEALNGITSICPATMSLPSKKLLEICKAAGGFSAGADEAALVGIHLEGPFLSLEKRGAQNPKYLAAPDINLVRKLNQASGGLVKLISLAPELPGSMEFIRELRDEFILSAAHTTADYSLAGSAFDEGISHITHLYNAMIPFTHRAPGLIGAAYDSPDCHVELICDGVHVDPAAVRMTFSLFGDDRIILISDSMMATGLSDGSYSLGGQVVHVHGSLAALTDDTIAGSVTNLYQCMTNAVNMGIPLESAVKCATMNPAKEIGIYKKTGSITPGKYADLLLLNSDLSLHSILLRGKKILRPSVTD